MPPERDPDVWRDHAIVGAHHLLDGAGVAKENGDRVQLGLVDRLRLLIADRDHLRSHLHPDN